MALKEDLEHAIEAITIAEDALAELLPQLDRLDRAVVRDKIARIKYAKKDLEYELADILGRIPWKILK